MKPEVLLEALLQEAVSKMPDAMQKEIRSSKWRKDQMRKYGTSVFLDPVAMKFPVKWKGKYDCRMIHSASVHAAMFSKKGSSMNKPEYYQGILAKAKTVYAKNKCENDVKMKVQENDNIELSLSDIFEVYSL